MHGVDLFLLNHKIGLGIYLQILVINRVRVLGNGPHTPHPIFLENKKDLHIIKLLYTPYPPSNPPLSLVVDL